MKRNQEEIELQQVVDWFKLQYPQYAKFFKVNYDRYEKDKYKASLQKKLQVKIPKYPDSFLSIPKKDKEGRIYCGLFMEMKKTGVTVLNKRTQAFKKNEHLQGQNAYLNELNDLGYYAVFGLGFENAVEIIKKYMSLENLK